MRLENLLRAWPDDLLSQAARGEIDLNEAAHWELVNRGKDAAGQYVGAEQAINDWQEIYGTIMPEGRARSVSRIIDRATSVIVAVLSVVAVILSVLVLLPGGK